MSSYRIFDEPGTAIWSLFLAMFGAAAVTITWKQPHLWWLSLAVFAPVAVAAGVRFYTRWQRARSITFVASCGVSVCLGPLVGRVTRTLQWDMDQALTRIVSGWEAWCSANGLDPAKVRAMYASAFLHWDDKVLVRYDGLKARGLCDHQDAFVSWLPGEPWDTALELVRLEGATIAANWLQGRNCTEEERERWLRKAGLW